MKLLLGAVLLVGASVLALACGSSDELNDSNGVGPLSTRVGSPTEGRGAVAAVLEPSLEIKEPKDGEMIDSRTVTIKVAVSDFKLTDKIGDTSAAGEGHVLYVMDPAANAGPDSGGAVAETADKEHRWNNVSPGEHTFSAYLVNNNGMQLEPKVMEQVTVMVR